MKVVRIPIPTPFLVGPVNAYLIISETLTLVDCGPLTETAWQALVVGIEGAGCRLDRLQRLVLTHSHIDHAGLANRLQRISGCEVFAHPIDHAVLRADGAAWESLVVHFMVEACRRAGTPAPALRAMERQLASHGKCREAIDAVTALEEGTTLQFSEGHFEVLHTPGHSNGSLCLWEPEAGLLVSGDTLIPHISSNALLAPGVNVFREKSLPAYLRNLERIASMAPVSVFPGHGEPMGPPQSLIRERIAFCDRRAEQIRQLVEQGEERPWAIGNALFPATEPDFVFLPVSEVVGHLDLLAGQGVVRFEGIDDPWEVRPRCGAEAPAR